MLENLETSLYLHTFMDIEILLFTPLLLSAMDWSGNGVYLSLISFCH